MASLDNFLALEPLMMAELQKKLADMSPKVHVFAAPDLQSVVDSTAVTPAVFVVYLNYSVVESRSDCSARVDQTWLAVVKTRNVKDLQSGIAARTDSGLIAWRVTRALMGFKPGICTKPLRLVGAPPAGSGVGFSYLPLAFATELALLVA